MLHRRLKMIQEHVAETNKTALETEKARDELQNEIEQIEQRLHPKRARTHDTHEIPSREHDKGCEKREVGRVVRSSKTRERKRSITSRVSSKKKTKRSLWRRESVPYPRKPTRPKNRSMKKE